MTRVYSQFDIPLHQQNLKNRIINMKKKTKSIDDELSFIARHLMLYGSYIPNLGILSGKMGIAIFFYHYAAYTKCSRYRRFADELIEEVYHEVAKNTPKDFANGLCGIVWGLTYLVQCGFLDMDDDIFEELDSKIMEWDISNITDYSIETGLSGVGLYLICRLHSCKENHTIPLTYSEKVLKRLAESHISECQMVYDSYKNKQLPLSVQLNSILYSLLPQYNASCQAKMLSIKDGLAGVGLRLITCGVR